MSQNNRREFLADVGQGMLVASLGSALAADLGVVSPAFADTTDPLNFGGLEPLVAQMQDTTPAKLQPVLVEKIKSGTNLKTLVAAGALANARSFGGEDYIGFHTAMALMPAWAMSKQMPKGLAALPILKVLYRNSERIQEFGGRRREVLKKIDPQKNGAQSGADLKKAFHRGHMAQAEQVFSNIAQSKPLAAYNTLLPVVHEDAGDVHRVALAWRAWDVMNLAGQEHAHTLLRQSVRFCVRRERTRQRRNHPVPGIRSTLPRLVDQYKLAGKKLGTKRGDDRWLEEMTQTIFSGSRTQGCEAVAIALSEGYSVASIAEALALASTRLVLNDPGRRKAGGRKGHSAKPIGSVHGDSIGVHASDAANAWRNIAGVSNHLNCVASLICSAWYTAGKMGRVGREPYPIGDEIDALRGKNAKQLLAAADAAIQRQEQATASAAVTLYGQLNGPAKPMFELLLKYAVSQDGALHGEKYYQTISEEFVHTRPKHRWQHMVGLARVTASEYGWAAPGHRDAMRLLRS